MSPYGLVTFASSGEATPGLLVGGSVVDLRIALGNCMPAVDVSSMVGILETWTSVKPLADGLASDVRAGTGAVAVHDLAAVSLLAPVRWPRGIFCASANFRDHVREWTGQELPDKATTRPCFFFKAPFHTLVGPYDVVHLPRDDAKVFNEVELAVVIGERARSVPEEQAMEHVAGYAIFNDVSDFSQSQRQDWYGQRFGMADWLRIKSFDNSSVLGPMVVPADQVADPYALDMKLWVNDELVQESSTSMMHYSIAEQISYLSEQLTLLPGDVVTTGSVRGIGAVRGVFLEPGDVVRAEIASLGQQRVVVGEPPKRP